MNKKATKNLLYFVIIPAIIGILVAFFIRSNVFSLYRVNGNEMYPTLKNNQLVTVIPKNENNLIRGAVIAYEATEVLKENSGMSRATSRIIGLPGDKVSFINGELKVNNNVVRDAYVYKYSKNDTDLGIENGWTIKILSSNLNWPLKQQGVSEVPKDAFFILNDNRSNTIDSRSYGFVEKENIIGVIKSIPFQNPKYSSTVDNGDIKFFK